MLVSQLTLCLQRGNLQDAINSHLINGTSFSEYEMLRLFRGACEAVRAMHTYRAPLASSSQQSSSSRPSNRQNESIPASARPRVLQNGSKKPARNGHVPGGLSDDEGDDDDDDLLPQPEGDNDGGYSYHGKDGGSSIPLVTKHAMQDEGEVVFDGDEELADHGAGNSNVDPSTLELVPYAHRDLKPG